MRTYLCWGIGLDPHWYPKSLLSCLTKFYHLAMVQGQLQLRQLPLGQLPLV